MQLSDIRTAVRRQTLIPTGDLSDASLNAIINEGVRLVAGAQRWPWLQQASTITTVASQTEYNLPADYMFMDLIVRNGKKIKLKEIPFEYYTQLVGDDPNTSADSRYYYLRESTIGLYPTPSANETDAYHIYYFEKPTELSNDSDTPEWVDLYHHVLVEYGISRVFEREEMYQEAQLHYQKFVQLIAEMAKFYRLRHQGDLLIYGDGRRSEWDWRLHFSQEVG